MAEKQNGTLPVLFESHYILIYCHVKNQTATTTTKQPQEKKTWKFSEKIQV